MASKKSTTPRNLFSDLFQEHHREIKQEAGKLLRDLRATGVKTSSTAPTWETRGGILNILEYVEGSFGLELKPFPVQRFVIKLYYHLPLDSTEKTIIIHDKFREKLLYRFTETEYLQYLFNEGRANIKEQDHPRNELILIAGRRSGKTLFSSVFASYEIYRLICLGDPQAYYGVPPNNRIQIISVATDKEQASLLFSELSGHINKFQYFAPYIQNNTMSFVNFRTPADIERNGPSQRSGDGKFVSYTGKTGIRATFKASVAKGLRGAGNILIVLDELAHFKGKGQASGKDVYDAVVPSAAAYSPKDPVTNLSVGPVESRVISITSPLGKNGFAYDLWCQAMSGGEPSKNKLALQIPTWEMNPSVDPQFFKEKYHSDPKVFTVEYGAQFSDSSFGWWDDDAEVLDCCPPDLRPVEVGVPRFPYYVGLDIGLKGDATVICIGHVDMDGIVTLDYHEVWRAGTPWEESNPHLSGYSCEYASQIHLVSRLDFDSIADWVEILSKRFSFVGGVFDRWNGIPLEQALLKRGISTLKSVHFTQGMASKVAQTFKTLAVDRKLRLYNHPVEDTKPKAPHIRELLALQAEYLSKYTLIVHKPKAPGASDDFFDAFSRMVSVCFEEAGSRPYIAPSSSASQGHRMSPHTAGLRKIMAGNIPPRINPRSALGRRLRVR